MNRAAIQSLIKKIAKKTPGRGMADDVPAVIKRAGGGMMPGGDQPAALSEGEYVIDAQTVSLIGDGNSDAGAKILKQLVEEIRRLKMGKKTQPKPITELLK